MAVCAIMYWGRISAPTNRLVGPQNRRLTEPEPVKTFQIRNSNFVPESRDFHHRHFWSLDFPTDPIGSADSGSRKAPPLPATTPIFPTVRLELPLACWAALRVRVCGDARPQKTTEDWLYSWDGKRPQPFGSESTRRCAGANASSLLSRRPTFAAVCLEPDVRRLGTTKIRSRVAFPQAAPTS
jgi:hypothetical protein